MQCPDMLELNAYVDGEMSQESQRQMHFHLQQCLPCRDRVAALQDDNRMIRDAWHGMDLPADLEACIHGRLRRQEQSWWTLKAGVAALLLVSGLVALAGNWIPLIKELASVLQSMLGGSLAMQLLILLGRFLTVVTEQVVQGEPVGMTQTFIVLLACLAGVLIQSRKGGYDNA